MSKELPGYRENLEDILAFTGGKRMLAMGDLLKYTGFGDPRTVRRHFPLENGYISAATLARCLSQGGRK